MISFKDFTIINCHISAEHFDEIVERVETSRDELKPDEKAEKELADWRNVWEFGKSEGDY